MSVRFCRELALHRVAPTSRLSIHFANRTLSNERGADRAGNDSKHLPTGFGFDDYGRPGFPPMVAEKMGCVCRVSACTFDLPRISGAYLEGKIAGKRACDED